MITKFRTPEEECDAKNYIAKKTAQINEEARAQQETPTSTTPQGFHEVEYKPRKDAHMIKKPAAESAIIKFIRKIGSYRILLD